MISLTRPIHMGTIPFTRFKQFLVLLWFPVWILSIHHPFYKASGRHLRTGGAWTFSFLSIFCGLSPCTDVRIIPHYCVQVPLFGFNFSWKFFFPQVTPQIITSLLITTRRQKLLRGLIASPLPAQFIALNSPTIVFAAVTVTIASLPGLRPGKVLIVSQMMWAADWFHAWLREDASKTRAPAAFSAGISKDTQKHWLEKQYELFMTYLRFCLLSHQ